MGLAPSALVRGIERELAKGSALKPVPAKKRAPSKGIAR
jgi:hypothetical protein